MTSKETKRKKIPFFALQAANVHLLFCVGYFCLFSNHPVYSILYTIQFRSISRNLILLRKRSHHILPPPLHLQPHITPHPHQPLNPFQHPKILLHQLPTYLITQPSRPRLLCLRHPIPIHTKMLINPLPQCLDPASDFLCIVVGEDFLQDGLGVGVEPGGDFFDGLWSGFEDGVERFDEVLE